MKNIKRRVEFFPFYDKTGIAKHLEKMALDGWLLEKISAFTWSYRRIAPTKMYFSVSYYATLTDFEPELTEEQQTFNEFCEHSGWKLAASTVQMQIFYNEIDNPVPIETDPTLEIENIHRKIKKTTFPSFFMLLFCSFLFGVSFISTLLGDPIHLLSSATRMFTGVWCVAVFAYALTEIVTYYTWRTKAKKMAEQGEFLETRGHRVFGYAILIFMLVSIALYLISLGNTDFQFFMTAFVMIFLAGFLIVNGVKNLLKKRKVSAGTNKVLTSIASFSLAFVLVGAVNFVTIRGIQKGIFDNSYNELPIKIGDLLTIDDSNYLQSHSIENSILLGQNSSSQHPLNDTPGASMSYTITEVKMPFLYDFVIDKLYHRYDEWRGYNSEYEYVEIGADEWGANNAWELYKDGKPNNHFLVCYDKYILEIEVDWELNTEQKEIIYAAINNP